MLFTNTFGSLISLFAANESIEKNAEIKGKKRAYICLPKNSFGRGLYMALLPKISKNLFSGKIKSIITKDKNGFKIVKNTMQKFIGSKKFSDGCDKEKSFSSCQNIGKRAEKIPHATK